WDDAPPPVHQPASAPGCLPRPASRPTPGAMDQPVFRLPSWAAGSSMIPGARGSAPPFLDSCEAYRSLRGRARLCRWGLERSRHRDEGPYALEQDEPDAAVCDRDDRQQTRSHEVEGMV